VFPTFVQAGRLEAFPGRFPRAALAPRVEGRLSRADEHNRMSSRAGTSFTRHLSRRRGRRKTHRMALSGRREGADAIRERIGPDARYSTFVPPQARGETFRPKRNWPWGRVLWSAALLSLVVVLALAALVALGL
jgi:hypothetical protein